MILDFMQVIGKLILKVLVLKFPMLIILNIKTFIEAKGFGPRPFWRNAEVHGKKLKPFLGFYPVQIEAFKALAKTLHRAYDIPLVTPMDGENLLRGVDPDVQKGLFKGVINHYHITTRKIDCAGLELDKVLKEIT